MKSKLYIIIFIIIVIIPAKGDIPKTHPDLKFDKLNINSGLSSNTITEVIQDKKGFLWIGTEEGLNRYDGYNFKIYKYKAGDSTSLSHNYIWDIREDSLGYIWIATDDGLNKFDPVKEIFTHFKHNPDDSTSLSNNVVQSLYIDRENNLWVGTWEGGLCRYDYSSNSFSRYQHNPNDDESISNNKIFTIYEDSNSNLWIGTDGGGVSVLDRKTNKFISYSHNPNNPESISGNAIVSIEEDSRGSLWFGTYGDGLCRFYPDKKIFKRYVSTNDISSLSGNTVWSIFEDSRGVLWIGTLSNGICIYDNTNDNFIRHKNNPLDPLTISSDYIRKIFEDRSGVLWIGTIAGGVNKIDRKPEKFFHLKNDPNNKNSISKNFIYSILKDSKGDLWFGTHQKQLDRYIPAQNKFIHYTNIPGDITSYNGVIARSLFEDSFGELWIGTYFGSLNKFDRKNNSFKRIDLSEQIKENSSVENIRAIFEDKNKILWFGTNGGGLLKYNREDNSFKRYSTESSPSLSDDHILSICEDTDGNLWVGTYGGGLNKFDIKNEKIIHYKNDPNDPNSLNDNVITELFLSSAGDIWIGTYFGGLNKYNKNSDSFTHYTTDEGLGSNLICDIIEDNKGLFWLSTVKGITKFNPSTGTIKNYDYSSGVPGEFNPGAGFQTKRGWIYFGGMNGVTYFHPDSLFDNPFIPNLVISSFRKINKEINLDKNISYTDTVTLSYDDIYFSIEFSALDYTKPSKNNYAYMLEGFDKEWIYSGNRNIATYTNIDPGEYIFKVKGTNNDGNWNEAGVSLFVIIKPPFWATWWFTTVFILGFLSIGPIIYFKRVNTLKKEKKQQEEFSKRLIHSQEEERKRIASELHDSLGQNLLIIKNRAALGLKSEKYDFNKEQLDEISKGASSAIDEIRRIAYNLHPYQLDRLGLTKALKSIITQIEILNKVHFIDLIENIDGVFSKEKEIIIYRIVQECINNIIKHSEAYTAEIKININDDILFMTISDNGKGFEVKQINSKSKGFGMRNLSERIKILNGELVIDSSSEKGSRLIIKIPVHNKE